MQINPNIDPKILFSSSNIKRYILSLFSFIFVFSFILIYTSLSLYNNVINDYTKKIVTIDNTEGMDMSLMCNVLSCKYVMFKENNVDFTYININGIVNETTFKPVTRTIVSNITRNWNTILEYKNLTFIIDDTKYLTTIGKLYFISMGMFTLFFSLAFFIKLLGDYKANSIEKSSYKLELESRLQRDITESLHHEMATPITIIETLVNDLYAALYPCGFTKSGVCDFEKEFVNPDFCKNCTNNDKKRTIDSIAIDHYSKIMFGVNRINTILNIMAGSKHIKYSNGTVSLFTILDNIISSNNSFKVNKLTAEYENREILDNYACGYGLANGEMLMVVHAMVVNSIEAKATKINFKPELIGNNMCRIMMTDNGRGIRDKNNKIVKSHDIFNYGYSTKDENGEQVSPKSFYKKFMVMLGFNMSDDKTPRGVGLSVNKRILMKSNGDINLVTTSPYGTVFAITLPIKERKDVHT